MTGYSEVLQTIGAVIIFSMILMNANHMIHRNTVMQIQVEMEQEVISIGQEIIEEARSRSFDQVTVNAEAPPSLIPEGFTDSEFLGPAPNQNNRFQFDDFDDYNGWEETFITAQGEFNLRAEVFYVDPATYDSTGDKSTFKKIRVFIESEFLRSGTGKPYQYQLEFLRNYYAD